MKQNNQTQQRLVSESNSNSSHKTDTSTAKQSAHELAISQHKSFSKYNSKDNSKKAMSSTKYAVHGTTSPQHIPVSKSSSNESRKMMVSPTGVHNMAYETVSSQSHFQNKQNGVKNSLSNGHQVAMQGTTKSLPGMLSSNTMNARSNRGHHTSNGYVHKHGGHHGRPPFSGTGSRHHGKIIHSPNPFRRPEPKQTAISFFDIDLNKSERFQYRPGEEVCGSIHMDVRRSVEIRFLELVCVGEGKATLHKHKDVLPLRQTEVYLLKRTYVIGTGDARWTSVLTPGHYVSNFRVKLPKDIPSTLSVGDHQSGFMFEISYCLKVRICDNIGSSSVRSSSSSINNFVKVLMSKKQIFNVQQPFDLHQIPNALIPVLHEEEILLSCANNNTAYFTLSLDRAVFLAGDDIRLQLTAHLPSSQRIKDITCTLKQNILLSEINEKQTISLTQLTRKDPSGEERSGLPSTFEMTIPTQTHLLTSFLDGCKTVQVTYTLQVLLRLTPGGGRVLFAIPISIGPSAEPIYAEKTASRKIVPVFNRPVRFPCFSPSKPEVKKMNSTDQTSRSSQSINVVTKYSNSAFGQCFLCCLGGSAGLD